MQVHVFVLCYNEEAILPQTVQHYRGRFPGAVITILDNRSTDRSAELAVAAGCRVVQFDSGEQQDERLLRWVRSHLWREHVGAEPSWVIMCDMDEWLDACEKDLEAEMELGVTILTTQGINMVGSANAADASDIQLSEVLMGFLDENFSKRVCFYYPKVQMEYGWGSHSCDPQGDVVFSSKTYRLKHYDCIGLEFLVEKNRRRWVRNDASRSIGMNGHYSNERDEVVERYHRMSSLAVPLTSLP